MSSLVQRIPSEDFLAWARLSANAYPAFGISSEEELSRFADRMRAQAEENPDVVNYGCYRDGVLVGGMRAYDYDMNTCGEMLPAGGVGSVAVDLAHKKEKVARDLILFFIRHFRERSVPITLLYPFRPDFYLAMGYGYGTKMSRYRFKPVALPGGGDHSRVRFAGRDDQEQIVACYNRFVASRHGMILKAHYELNGMFNNPAHRLVAYWDADGGDDGETVRGYLRFTFKSRTPENLILNDLVVAELIYETPAALAGLLAFLRSQADQVDRVVLQTLDESFYHLLSDPRDGIEALIPHVYHESEVTGVGLMYRVSDVPAVFRLLTGAGHDFGDQSLTLRLTVRDSFVPENDGSVLIRFEHGRATVLEGGAGGEANVAAQLDVARFSSLLMGSVTFERLYTYGLVEVSDAGYVPVLDRLFRTAEKPMCITPF